MEPVFIIDRLAADPDIHCHVCRFSVKHVDQLDKWDARRLRPKVANADCSSSRETGSSEWFNSALPQRVCLSVSLCFVCGSLTQVFVSDMTSSIDNKKGGANMMRLLQGFKVLAPRHDVRLSTRVTSALGMGSDARSTLHVSGRERRLRVSINRVVQRSAQVREKSALLHYKVRKLSLSSLCSCESS
jgi:hypothetical protein